MTTIRTITFEDPHPLDGISTYLVPVVTIAKRLKVSPRSLLRAAENGTLPPVVRMGGRHFFHTHELRAHPIFDV